MNRLFLIIILSMLSACGIFSVRDGAMGITGNVGPYTDGDCFVKVLLRSEREVRRFDLLSDSLGNFFHNFTVAPGSAEYKIEIECGGKVVSSKMVSYPTSLENGFVLKFGELE